MAIRKLMTMRVAKKNKKELNLKEVVGQCFSDRPTTSNNRNADSIIICD